MVTTEADLLGAFLDRDSVDRGDLDLSVLRRALPVWRMYDTADADPVSERMEGVSVVVSNKVVLDETMLVGAPGLKLVCVAATGTNNVDLEAAARLGIRVCNVRAYATPAVVQHVFALILALPVPGWENPAGRKTGCAASAPPVPQPGSPGAV